ncbi:MAG: hypothetical protein ACKVS8_04530 [Phycisphaerales bacterium]
MLHACPCWRVVRRVRGVVAALACGATLLVSACEQPRATGEGQVVTTPTGSAATVVALPPTDTTVVAINTGVVGPAAGTTAATTAVTVNPGQKLIDDGRVIVAKLRSGEKTPQTLTPAERQTLLTLEALRQRSKKRD